jgi:hypothetical protein
MIENFGWQIEEADKNIIWHGLDNANLSHQDKLFSPMGPLSI